MKKRGQIAVFLILGVAVIVLVSFVGYTQFSLVKKETSSAVKETVKTATEVVPIKKYAESCLRYVGDTGLWLIGEHGGYIDPAGDEDYDEVDIGSSLYTTYNGKNVPYYLVGTDDSYALTLEEIEEKLSKYIIVEFEKCFDLTTFEDDGLYIRRQDINYTEINFDFDSVDVAIDVSINLESVTVKIEYPLNISKRDFRTKLKDFRVELPVRLGRIYNATLNSKAPEGLLKNITDEWGDGNTYDLSNFNCDLHDPLEQINIYSRDNDDGDTKIIRLVDYKPYYNKYLKAYVFQIAIKGNDPIDFMGDVCRGT